MSLKHQVVIIGGGNAGISVAAQLKRKDKKARIEKTLKLEYCGKK